MPRLTVSSALRADLLLALDSMSLSPAHPPITAPPGSPEKKPAHPSSPPAPPAQPTLSGAQLEAAFRAAAAAAASAPDAGGRALSRALAPPRQPPLPVPTLFPTRTAHPFPPPAGAMRPPAAYPAPPATPHGAPPAAAQGGASRPQGSAHAAGVRGGAAARVRAAVRERVDARFGAGGARLEALRVTGEVTLALDAPEGRAGAGADEPAAVLLSFRDASQLETIEFDPQRVAAEGGGGAGRVFRCTVGEGGASRQGPCIRCPPPPPPLPAY